MLAASASRCDVASATMRGSSLSTSLRSVSGSGPEGRSIATSNLSSSTASDSATELASVTIKSTLGNLLLYARMHAGTTGFNAVVPVTPIRRTPDSPAAARRASRIPSLRRVGMSETACRNAYPAGVSSTPCERRRNRLVPISLSMTFICWLKGGWAIPRYSAARVKLLSWAIAKKYRT